MQRKKNRTMSLSFQARLSESPKSKTSFRLTTPNKNKYQIPRLMEIYSPSTSANTSGVSKISPIKLRNPQIPLNIEDDYFFFGQYRKVEIVKSRKISDAKFPFWFQDTLADETKTLSPMGWVDFQDVGVHPTDRKEFSSWALSMQNQINFFKGVN